MYFTLYDYLIIYQYKIIEAIKNGFPKNTDYNKWIYFEILNPLIKFENNMGIDDNTAMFKSGVYMLGDYYIGQTSKPIILRILEHLFETIPTCGTNKKKLNIDKIICTKYDLLLDKPLSVNILSLNKKDEEDLIIDYSRYDDVFLVNKQFNPKPRTFIDRISDEIIWYGESEYNNIKNKITNIYETRLNNDPYFEKIFNMFEDEYYEVPDMGRL